MIAGGAVGPSPTQARLALLSRRMTTTRDEIDVIAAELVEVIEALTPPIEGDERDAFYERLAEMTTMAADGVEHHG
jgi:hypothetical protein